MQTSHVVSISIFKFTKLIFFLSYVYASVKQNSSNRRVDIDAIRSQITWPVHFDYAYSIEYTVFSIQDYYNARFSSFSFCFCADLFGDMVSIPGYFHPRTGSVHRKRPVLVHFRRWTASGSDKSRQ